MNSSLTLGPTWHISLSVLPATFRQEDSVYLPSKWSNSNVHRHCCCAQVRGNSRTHVDVIYSAGDGKVPTYQNAATQPPE